jgi:2-dehydro-3-deoxygluconokinase
MGKVLSFGELLLRLSPPATGEWLKDHSMPVFVGGAELNVANALARWDTPVSYFTALPQHLLSSQIVEDLQQKKIDVSRIHYGGDRIGIYFLPVGGELKNAGVIYDRANSSFATLGKGVVDWNKVLDGVSWFHFSAICPGVSQAAADLCEEALQAASEKGITISLDLNYRAKLWKFGKQPVAIMPALAKYCNLIMGNIWAAHNMLGIALDNKVDEHKKEIYLQQALKTSADIIAQFPACRSVANTFRFDEGNGGVRYYTTLFENDHLYESAEYETAKVIDKVGSGDCFMAGLIYGHYHGLASQEIVDFATAAAFQKLFIKGDATDQTAQQIRTLIKEHA